LPWFAAQRSWYSRQQTGYHPKLLLDT